MGLLTGSIYFGWAALAEMILRSGRFASMCPQDEKGNFVGDGRALGRLSICDAQDAAVQHLYSITLFTMTAASLFAGAMMDSLGPRSTAILGYFLNILGSVCLATSQWGGDVFLYFGVILIGAATDTAFLPILSSARLFPHHSGFVICILGSAASASFGVPPVLEAIADYLQLHQPLDVFWGYAVAGPGLCLLLACLFLPNTGFLSEDMNTASGSVHHQYEELLDATEMEAGNHGMRAKQQESMMLQGVIDGSAWPYIFSLEYLLVSVYFAVVSCAVVFYQEAPSRYFSSVVVKTLEAALPLSFVPCVLLGWVADKCGILTSMAIVTANGIMSYVCALSSRDVLGYISVFCFTNFISIFTSQIFVYTEKRFPPRHFGKIIGSLQLLGGALALVCNPLYSAVAVYHEVPLSLVTKFIIGALTAQYVWLFLLWRLQRAGYLAPYPSDPASQSPK